ncbi:MAG: hypothetical protein ACE5PM_09790 [Candidatus Hydrothermarchaeales archaeon]
MAEERRKGLNYKWIGIGFIAMVVLAIAGLSYLIIFLGVGMERLYVELGLIWLDSFFIGGLIIGRMSPGRTILEPAIAAVLALIALFLLVEIGIFQTKILIILIHAFLFALVGGYLGEKWQGTI